MVEELPSQKGKRFELAFELAMYFISLKEKKKKRWIYLFMIIKCITVCDLMNFVMTVLNPSLKMYRNLSLFIIGRHLIIGKQILKGGKVRYNLVALIEHKEEQYLLLIFDVGFLQVNK